MNSIKLFLAQSSSPDWPIRVEQKPGWNMAEITDHFSSLRASLEILYFDLLESVFAECKNVYLCEKEDQRIVGDCKKFANKIWEDFSVGVNLSSDFDSSKLPEPNDREFVLHVISPFNRTLWQEIVGFGAYNLPNFAYSLDGMNDTSLKNLFEINNNIVSWFELRINDSEFAKILKIASPVFLTIDRHLCFFFSSNAEFDELMKTLSVVAERHSLKPVIKD